MSKQVLTFDTLQPERDFIVIDKGRYFLRSEAELSLMEIAKIRRAAKVIQQKGISAESTEEDMALVIGFVDQVLDTIILGLPPEVRDRLSIMQKAQIIQVFMSAASRRTGEAAEDGSPTTGGSSPDSSGSMGEASATG